MCKPNLSVNGHDYENFIEGECMRVLRRPASTHTPVLILSY